MTSREITRAGAAIITEKINKAIQEVADEFGLKLRPHGTRFDTNSIKFSVDLQRPISEEGASEFANAVAASDRQAWKRECIFYDLKKEWLDQEFTSQGETYVIVGLKPRRRKYPVSAVLKRTGKVYKFTAKAVAQSMDK